MLARGGEVAVQNELDLLVGLAAADEAGTGVELHPVVPHQGSLHVQGTLGDLALLHVRLAEYADILAADQIVPEFPLQAQTLAGDGVDIPQADALEEGGLVELGQGAVQPGGEVLPPGVAQGGQGDEALGQVELPAAVLRDEVVVGNGLLRLQRGGVPLLDHLGGELLLTGRILGEVLADGLLKLGGLLGADGQDGGEAELADHLHQRGAGVLIAFVWCKQHSGLLLPVFRSVLL